MKLGCVANRMVVSTRPVMTVANSGPVFAEVAARGITRSMSRPATSAFTTCSRRFGPPGRSIITWKPTRILIRSWISLSVSTAADTALLGFTAVDGDQSVAHRDAREEVRELVQQLNTGGPREFTFSKDIVLKTALLIADVDVRFRVSNFTQDNMKKVETAWDQTRDSLLRAATLMDISASAVEPLPLTACSYCSPIICTAGVWETATCTPRPIPRSSGEQNWVTRSLGQAGNLGIRPEYAANPAATDHRRLWSEQVPRE